MQQGIPRRQLLRLLLRAQLHLLSLPSRRVRRAFLLYPFQLRQERGGVVFVVVAVAVVAVAVVAIVGVEISRHELRSVVVVVGGRGEARGVGVLGARGAVPELLLEMFRLALRELGAEVALHELLDALLAVGSAA